jgi:hypothetical protein
MLRSRSNYPSDSPGHSEINRRLAVVVLVACAAVALVISALAMAGCGLGAFQGAKPFPTGGPAPKPQPVVTHNVACVVTDADNDRPVDGATCSIGSFAGQTNGDGYVLLIGIGECHATDPVVGCIGLTATKDGYDTNAVRFINDHDQNVAITLKPIVPPFPPAPSRQEILDAHESFQGAVLHTSQFGDLNWWPTAWVSLSDADRGASYAQIASWGDTDITVSIAWEYGEPGQPYGSGQLVPPSDLTGKLPRFRALVKDVIQHTAANGKPFVPVIFMEGDNGFNYYMWVMPLVVQALRPQPTDPIDLTQYVKLRMCYDSCVPGWAGDNDSKQFISQAILATRAACPACVIALEFSSGYSSQGDGGDFWDSDAGRALDEVDWEGNSWPPNNWEQYWEILDRWLGPAYIRPAAQTSDPAAPFPATDSRFYLRNGTPRGPFSVHCLEPFTYQWVRGQVAASQVPVAYQVLQSLGCPVIDMPTAVPR